MRYRRRRHPQTRDAKWGGRGPCETVCSWQHSNFDVAEGDHVAVILESDVSLRVFAEPGIGLELAARDFRIPIRAPQLVFQQLEAVQPVLDVVAGDDEPRRIPFAPGMHVPGR